MHGREGFGQVLNLQPLPSPYNANTTRARLIWNKKVCPEARFYRERQTSPPAACPSLSPTPCPCEGCEGGVPGRIKGVKTGKGSGRASYRGGIIERLRRE